MTWSIVARDAQSGAFGTAVASRFFAVGALCPHLKSGAGALSSQSLVNPYLGIWGLRLLEGGMRAPGVLDTVLAADPARETRQIHIIDGHDAGAAHTGAECVPWCGHRLAEGVSVAGNMLAGERVIADTLDTFLSHADKPFAERLLRAMDAGERAGGDKRGRQAAGLRIVSTEDYADLDLRVDDHADPIAELWRLYQVAHERFLARMELMPRRADPIGAPDFTRLEAELEARLAAREAPDFSAFWRAPVRP